MIYSIYGSLENNPTSSHHLIDIEAASKREAISQVSIDHQKKYTVVACTYFWAYPKEIDPKIESWSKLKEAFIDLFDQKFWKLQDQSSSILLESDQTSISLETYDINGSSETCGVSISCSTKEFIDLGFQNIERLRTELDTTAYVLWLAEEWKTKRFLFDPCLDEEERSILDEVKKGLEIHTKPVFSGCVSDMISELVGSDSKRKIDWMIFEKLYNLGFLRLVKKTYLGASYKLI